jgi:hypothetical protein
MLDVSIMLVSHFGCLIIQTQLACCDNDIALIYCIYTVLLTEEVQFCYYLVLIELKYAGKAIHG